MGDVVKLKTETTAERSSGKHNLKGSGRHLQLTPKRIDMLIRDGQTGYFYDEKLRGLAVRIGKTKAVYVHALRVGASYQRRTLGNVGTMLLADARKAVTAAAGSIARGDLPTAPREERRAAKREKSQARVRESFTVDRAFANYLDDRELKPKTRRTYEDVWRHVPADVSAMPMAELDDDTVANLHRKIGRKTKRTVNKLMVLLSAVCGSAGRRANNPVAEIRRYHEKPRARRLTPEEADRLHAVLERGRQDPDIGRRMIAVYVTTALLTGARRSSISAMRWTDLDRRAGPRQLVDPGGVVEERAGDDRRPHRPGRRRAHRMARAVPARTVGVPVGGLGDRPSDGTQKGLGPDPRRGRHSRRHPARPAPLARLRARRRWQQRGDDRCLSRPRQPEFRESLPASERQ